MSEDLEPTADLFEDPGIPRYEAKRRLGEGSFGQAFLATDRNTGFLVVLKVSKQTSVDARFREEVRMADRCRNCANLLSKTDSSFSAPPYVAYEFVEGSTLRELMEQGASWTTRRIFLIAANLASGLSQLHSLGILHRDLKPANMIVGNDGHVTIIDFGLGKDLRSASLTKGQLLVGTPMYLAPETIGAPSKSLGTADIYSFGVILYQLLRNNLPYEEFLIDSYKKTIDWHAQVGLLRRMKEGAAKLVARSIQQLPPGTDRLQSRLLQLALDCLSADEDHRISNGTQLHSLLAAMWIEHCIDQEPDDPATIADALTTALNLPGVLPRQAVKHTDRALSLILSTLHAGVRSEHQEHLAAARLSETEAKLTEAKKEVRSARNKNENLQAKLTSVRAWLRKPVLIYDTEPEARRPLVEQYLRALLEELRQAGKGSRIELQAATGEATARLLCGDASRPLRSPTDPRVLEGLLEVIKYPAGADGEFRLIVLRAGEPFLLSVGASRTKRMVHLEYSGPQQEKEVR